MDGRTLTSTEVKSKREIRIRLNGPRFNCPGRMTLAKKAREAAAFSFESVYGESGVTAPAWVSGVIGAPANAALIPSVDDVENKRSMDADRWVQTTWGLPGTITDAGDIFAIGSGGVQRNRHTAHGKNMTGIDQTLRFYLKTFD